VPAGRIVEKIDAPVAALFERAKAAEAASPEEGIAAWREVAQKARRHRTPLRALARLHEALEQWAPLADALRKEAGLVTKRAEKRALMEALAVVYRDRLHLNVRAVSVLQQLLQLEPGDAGVLDDLANLYEQLKRWNDLIAILRQRAPLGATTEQQAATWLRVADLYADRVANKTQAIDAYQQVLQLDAGSAPAIARLKKLYEARRDWAGIIDLSRREIALLDDDGERAARYAEAARMASSKLDNPALAMDLWADVLAEAPWNGDAIAELERLCEQTGDWQRLADVLRRQALAAPDSEQESELLEKLASLLEARLDDQPGAIATWRTLLEIDPAHSAAQRALERLLVATDAFEELESVYASQSRWEDLARILERRADTLDPDEQPAMLLRVAALYRDELALRDQEVRLCERVLGVDADNLAAAEQLIPAYVETGDARKLARVLRVQLDHTGDTPTKRERLARLAELLETDANDPVGALAALMRQMELDPKDEALRDHAARLAELTGDWAARSLSLEQKLDLVEEADERKQILRQLAALHRDHSGDAERATRFLHDALALDVEDGETIAALAALVDQDAAGGEEWGDLGERPISLPGSNERVPFATVVRILRGGAHWPALADLLQRTDSVVAEHADEHVALRLALARVQEEHLEDRAAAIGTLEQATAIAPNDARPLDAMAELFRRAEDWSRLAEVSRERARAEADPAKRVRLLLTAAQAVVRDSDAPASARDLYREVLRSEPHNGEALTALERLYRQEERWPALLDVLRKRSSAAADADERLAVQLQVASLCAEELRDARSAIDTYEQILVADPTNPSALEALADLYQRSGRMAEYLELLQGRLERADSDAQRISYCRQIAAVCDKQLNRPDRAAAYLERAFRIDERGDHYRDLLRIHRRERRFESVVELIERHIAACEDASERIAAYLELGQLLSGQLADLEGAIAAYHAVLALDADNCAALDALARMQEECAAYDEAAASLTRLSVATSPGPERASALYRLGDLYQRRLGDLDSGEQSFQRALEEDPTHAASAQRLAGFLETSGDFASAANLLTQTAAVASDAPVRARLLARAGGLWERELDDDSKAAQLFARALDDDPSLADAGESLVRICERQKRHEELMHVLDLLLHNAARYDRRARHALHLKLARTAETLDRLDEAMQHYQAAWEIDPSDVPTLVGITNLKTRLRR